MKFIFQTANLDERRYKRIIHSFLVSSLPVELRKYHKEQIQNYQVFIRPDWMASDDPFFHGKDGVGGVTDKQKMILYLEDKSENRKDSVQRVLRKNSWVISHEMSHWLLMLVNLGHKVPLRNNDEMGHKKGTMLNYWTAEVHDRDIENKAFRMPFWIVQWSIFKLRPFPLKMLDIRDILENQ